MKPHLLLVCLLLLFTATMPALAQDAQIQVIEDFEGAEVIDLNAMANGSVEAAGETFELITNPDPDDVNPSAAVMRFTRASDGDPWAGFWSALPSPIDMTEMKYIHVQVWKPRISPIRFKVEGGTTDPSQFEIVSMEPQETTSQWENIRFHFEDATGEYPTIVFMPDFEDPVTLQQDIEIYFDNIVLSSSPEPPTVVSNDETPELPAAVRLHQNYPNPFNPSTTIQYSLDQASDVDLSVFDVNGRRVATLVSGTSAPGTHEVIFDAGGLPSGLYLYRLQAAGQSATRKLMLIK